MNSTVICEMIHNPTASVIFSATSNLNEVYLSRTLFGYVWLSSVWLSSYFSFLGDIFIWSKLTPAFQLKKMGMVLNPNLARLSGVICVFQG